jgi:hypothetical protein
MVLLRLRKALARPVASLGGTVPFRSLSSMLVERGVLFSAPCLNPQVRQALFGGSSSPMSDTAVSSARGFLFTEPGLDPAVRLAYDQLQWPLSFSTTTSKSRATTKVEKGLLFSAPCLDYELDGQEKHA